jgi:hypothetical protein
MAVKVQVIDPSGHEGDEVTHEAATSISVNAGVLFVNQGFGMNQSIVALYQTGNWASAVVS